MARKAPLQDGLGILGKAWSEVKKINWHEVNRLCQQNFHIGLVGTESEVNAMRTWLQSFPYQPADGVDTAQEHLSAIAAVEDGLDEKLIKSTTFCLASGEMANEVRRMKGEVYLFAENDNENLTTRILSNHPEVQFALAHNFPVFRPELAQSVIQDTSFQNTAWALLTGLPNTVPGPHTILTSPFEGISDFTLMTLNEIKLMFELVGIAGNRVVPLYHLGEFGIIIGLGKLAETLAMQTMGRVSGRAAIIVKGAIAYAFTWTIGEAVFFYASTGRKLTQRTFNDRLRHHFVRGRKVTEGMVNQLH